MECSSCHAISEESFNCSSCNSILCSLCSNQGLCAKCQAAKSPKPLMTVKCSHLADVRVIQRDLVYIVGIPVNIANEDILLKYEYFGQYGPIKKVVVNSTNVHLCPNQTPSVSAYITFRNTDDALECIYSLESFSIGGNQLKASFGTTKYCSAFLRGQMCTNPDCMYLHHSGDQGDSFSKDEITGSCSRFVEMTRPSRPPNYDEYPKQDRRQTVLPPRRILTKSPLSVKKETPKDVKDSTFLSLLADDEEPGPIVIDDTPGLSLNEQFGLGRSSVRSVFYTLLQQKDDE